MRVLSILAAGWWSAWTDVPSPGSEDATPATASRFIFLQSGAWHWIRFNDLPNDNNYVTSIDTSITNSVITTTLTRLGFGAISSTVTLPATASGGWGSWADHTVPSTSMSHPANGDLLVVRDISNNIWRQVRWDDLSSTNNYVTSIDLALSDRSLSAVLARVGIHGYFRYL